VAARTVVAAVQLKPQDEVSETHVVEQTLEVEAE